MRSTSNDMLLLCVSGNNSYHLVTIADTHTQRQELIRAMAGIFRTTALHPRPDLQKCSVGSWGGGKAAPMLSQNGPTFISSLDLAVIPGGMSRPKGPPSFGEFRDLHGEVEHALTRPAGTA